MILSPLGWRWVAISNVRLLTPLRYYSSFVVRMFDHLDQLDRLQSWRSVHTTHIHNAEPCREGGASESDRQAGKHSPAHFVALNSSMRGYDVMISKPRYSTKTMVAGTGILAARAHEGSHLDDRVTDGRTSDFIVRLGFLPEWNAIHNPNSFSTTATVALLYFLGHACVCILSPHDEIDIEFISRDLSQVTATPRAEESAAGDALVVRLCGLVFCSSWRNAEERTIDRLA